MRCYDYGFDNNYAEYQYITIAENKLLVSNIYARQ